jgi:hypothetical protein
VMKKAGREARKSPCARRLWNPHPFGFPLGFARGFGKTGQALFAKCAKKDGHPAAAPTHRKEREEWATECEGLETQPCLELDYSSCETVGGMAELTCVDDVGRRLCGYQRREVQNVKDVEEVGPNCEL